jgi:peptide/nickel transport system permease protein
VFQYIVRRLLWAVVMILMVIAVVFFIFFVLPGGSGKARGGQCTSPVAVQMAGRNPRPELVCNITKRLGLDQPVYVQFWRYVKGLPFGDLGHSYHSQEDVTPLLLRRAPATIGLAIGASIIWLVVGVTVGVISALRRRTIFDRGAMFLALVGVSMPIFFIGLVAVFFFDGKLNIYSVASYVPITEDPVGWIASMWLPWVILAIVSAAVYARMVRGNLLEVMTEDYIRTARAKGLKEKSVTRHALRSALTPVVTLYGLDLGILLGGAVITEQIFNIPGIGRLAVSSITNSDLPVILGTTLVAATFVILANLIVDIVYAALDPRVRYS